MLKATVLLGVALCIGVEGRPTVRELRTYKEYQTLLDHHAKETGLPVVVDFFSNSCGPCRMIAPVYKRVAEEYKDRVVFAKVNMETNRETSSRLGIRSMPTFHFYADGKKQHEFSGAGEHQLRQLVQRMALDSEKKNVLLSLDTLLDYYTIADPSKTEKDIEKIHNKCISLSGKSKACVGSAARELGSKLEAKFRNKIKFEKRYQRKGKEASRKKESTSRPTSSSKATKKETASIRDFTIEEIVAELGRRGSMDGDELALAAFEAAEAYQTELEEEEDEDFEDLDDDDEGLPEYSPPQSANADPELVVVLGGGPAGLSAAIYAGRAGLSPVVVAPPGEGQLLSKGVTVENFPGINSTGIDLVQRMQLHAAEVGAAFYPHKVTKAHLESQPFVLETSSGLNITTHTLIVATGANARWLGVQGESDFRGGGVSSCATCDGFLFRDKHVVVIGGGDAAMEDALVLARTSASVTIVHRRDRFRASHAMADRALQHPLISVIWNATVSKFDGRFEDAVYYDNHGNEIPGTRPILESVYLKNAITGQSTQMLNASAAFVAIGHDPNTEWLPDELARDSNGYLLHANAFNCNDLTNSSRFVTALTLPGVFAAGDVADPTYRQAITSAGSGAAAALDAERFLSEVVGVGVTPGCAAAALSTNDDDDSRDILDGILMADDKLHHEDEHFFDDDQLHHPHHHHAAAAGAAAKKNSEL